MKGQGSLSKFPRKQIEGGAADAGLHQASSDRSPGRHKAYDWHVIGADANIGHYSAVS